MCENKQMLIWDFLRVFRVVARTRQMLAEARALGVNHATVARQINRLENALHENFLEWTNNGCRLTPAGARLMPFAERVESAVPQAQSASDRTEDEVTGESNRSSSTKCKAGSGSSPPILSRPGITARKAIPSLVEGDTQAVVLSQDEGVLLSRKENQESFIL